MRMKSALAAIAACSFGVLGGCATAPMTYTVENNVQLSESKDVVWERVVSFFAMNNLSIKTIEKDSGIIAAERMIGSPSMNGMIGSWASCGTGALEIARAQGVDLNVFVRSVSGGTNVTVNTRFNETRVFGDVVRTVDCNSTGELESLILSAARGG